MRNKLILSALFLLGFFVVHAQNSIIVTGTVTDEDNGEPVPGQEVMIDADSLYFSSVYTNESGVYVDTITVNQFIDFVNISTVDLCTFLLHDTTVIIPPAGTTVILADFEICTEITGLDCQAGFSYTTDSSNSYIVNFFDLSTPEETIISWFWDFGDNNSSTLQNPVHAYNAPGPYEVCLSIVSFNGVDSCFSTYCSEVVIGLPAECQADFYYVADSTDLFTVYFYDLSIPAGQIFSWYWEFGENAVSTLQNPVYSFGDPGAYTVCLTIVAFNGVDTCSSTYCEEIIVGIPSGCQANYTYSPAPANDLLIQFEDLSTPQGNISEWFWDFGDGSSSTEQNPIYQYGSSGTYNVCLTISTFPDSCTSTYCGEVLVGEPALCQADFYYVIDSTDLSTVSFYDQSTPASMITSWFWEFGDNAVSTEQNPTYTYSEPGIYGVCLTIVASMGEDSCTSTYCAEIEITGGGTTYYLGGNTFAGMYQLDEGFAYAYRVENGSYTDVYSQVLDTLGYYFFEVPEGNYYIKVEPTPNSVFHGDFLPTYFGDVIHWEDAQLLNINQNTYTADINLVEMSSAAVGTGLIGGHIYNHTGGKDGDPAANVQVMLANGQGEYIGMVFSDEEGYFEFPELAFGSYTLYAEVMGKSIVPKNFTLNENAQHVEDVVMVIGESSIVFSIDELSSKYVSSISELYPNPVSGYVRIDVETDESSVLEINILNMTGQYVQKNDMYIDQSRTVEVNTNELRPGIYLFEIITKDNIRISRRFVKH